MLLRSTTGLGAAADERTSLARPCSLGCVRLLALQRRLLTILTCVHCRLACSAARVAPVLFELPFHCCAVNLTRSGAPSNATSRACSVVLDMIRWFLLQNRAGRTRLAKYYVPLDDSRKRKTEYEVFRALNGRESKWSNIVEVCTSP
jgi:Clathrin adaptor complex small chain